MMAGDGIGYVGRNTILPAQGLKSVSPGLAWGEPLVFQAKPANPSTNYLSAIAPAVSEPIC
jgi:hypothetical protein